MRVLLFIFLWSLLKPIHAEHRGIWIVRNSLVSFKDFSLLKAIDNRIRLTDLYLQVRALGVEFLPQSESSDSLNITDIISFCKRRGIRIHAWINTLYIWSDDSVPEDPEHPFLADSNYILSDNIQNRSVNYLKRKGVEGFYVDPDSPKNYEAIKQLISHQIIPLGFDGVHLDYIRYARSPFHYSRHLRSLFMRRYFLDPLTVKLSNNFFWDAGDYFYINREYEDMLSELLNARLHDLYDFVKQHDSALLFSCAVKADYRAARAWYVQDWQQWLNGDYCDYVITMNYSVDDIEFKKNIKMAKSFNYDKRIVCGIGVYRLNEKTLADRIRYVKESRLAGYCLFSFSSFKEETNRLQGLY